MKRANSLSEAVSAAGERARYDAEAKRLIAEPQILARILAECVSEYRGLSPKEIEERYLKETMPLTGEPLHRDIMRPTEDISINEGTVHYDLLFHLDAPSGEETIRIYVNLEAQNTFGPDIPKRARYYGSRLLSSQYGRIFRHSEYSRLERVYSIWICSSVPEMLRNTVQIFRMQAEGKVDDAILKYYTGIDIDRIVFVNTGDRSDVNDITAVLGTLLDTDMAADVKRMQLVSRFGIEMTEEMERGISDMCNLSDGIFSKGIEQGIEKGIEIGKSEGREENMLASVASLMKNGNMSAEKAMELLSVPEADRPGILAKLK